MIRDDVILPMVRCAGCRCLFAGGVGRFDHVTYLLARPGIEGDDSRIVVPLCESCAVDAEADYQGFDYRVCKMVRAWLRMDALLRGMQADGIT
ncbi:MAG: hypothetical protein Q7R41_15795 [Phycisphaerales bacterium]|nr:hypothetical protein [Phycisphaerales bacterium]